MISTNKYSLALRWGHDKIVELFGADLRSLAAFRIALAILVLADLYGRATDLYAHYTDGGIMPRFTLLQEVLDPWSFSLNLMNGGLLFQATLFGVAALAALALLVGYRTRLATVIVWVLLLSIQYRNPMLLNAGDEFMRMLLFWGMLLPLGAYWSVDRARKADPPRLSMRFLSLATIALFMQIALMYWVSVLEKSGEEWRVDGTAIYYALSIDQYATPVGSFLLYNAPPLLLQALTFATVLFEAFGPFLLFCPFLTGPVRTGAVLAFMGFHFGIRLTLDIEIFSWAAALCMVCFLPAWFWDKPAASLHAALLERPSVGRRLRHATARLAHALVHDYWLPLRTRLSSGLSPIVSIRRPSIAGATVAHSGADERPGDHDGRVVASSATVTTAPRQGEPQPPAEAKREGSEPKMLRSSLAVDLLAAFFLLYVFCWNLANVSSFVMPEPLRPLGSSLGLQQTFGMFGPSPAKEDLWFVIPGTLDDGRQVDLLPAAVHKDFNPQGGLSWEKPRDMAGTYKNEHWRKYLALLPEEGHSEQLLHFGRYICREWNARHAGPDQLPTFQIVRMSEETLPDYRNGTPQKETLWEHECF